MFRGLSASTTIPKRRLIVHKRVVTDNRGMDEREAMRRWVETWKQAGPELEAILRKEIENIDVQKELAVLEDAFNYAVHHAHPEPTSGLVEMQDWFAKLRQ